jgi:zinc protease
LTGTLRETHDLSPRERAGLVCMLAPLSRQQLNDPVVRVMGAILKARLRERMRERLGMTYGPSLIGFQVPTAFRSSVLWLRVPTAPGSEADALRIAEQVLASFVADGPTDAEVAGTKVLVLGLLTEQEASNEHWLNALREAHGNDDALAQLADVRQRLTAVTREQVAEIAARLLAAERLSTLTLRARPD